MKEKIKSPSIIYEIFIVTALFIVICLIYKGQPRISYNEGKGWDGVVYYEMSRQFQQGETPIIEKAPFIKRVGTPFLIGTFSRKSGVDLLNSALLINLIGIFITTILLLFWLRIFIDTQWIRLLLLLNFMMAWHVPLRHSFFHPEGTDTWGALWFLGGLLVLHCVQRTYKKHHKFKFHEIMAFSLVVAVGYLFRETNAVLSILPFFIINPFKDLNISSKTLTIKHFAKIFKKTWRLYFVRQSLILFLPIISVIFASLIISNLTQIVDQDNYSYIIAACVTFYTKSLPEYLLAMFIAFGPLIILVPFYWKKFKSLLLERQELTVVLFIAFLLGYIGASSTERITFMMSFPIIFVLMGLAIKSIFKSRQRWWFFVLLALQTVAFRYYWIIPDYPNEMATNPIPFFTLIGNKFQVLDLYSNYGSILLNIVVLGEYVLLFFLTFYVLHNHVRLNIFKTPPSVSHLRQIG